MECQPLIDAGWSPDRVVRGLYRRLFFRRRPGLKADQTLPRLRCSASNVAVAVEKVAAYRFVIQDPRDESVVPLLYPHAFLGSAHLAIISHDQFPLGAIGLLHLRNHVLRARPFGVDQPWDVNCELARQRHVQKGLEFDLDATVTIGGQVVWQSVSTYLKRQKSPNEMETSSLGDLFQASVENQPATGQFDVPHDIGKRYAKVTGDYNPIHVSSLAAKLFGFRRAIAHGMWSVARTVQALPEVDGSVRNDVAFKGPMYVNSKASIRTGDLGRFDVYCGTNPRPVLMGHYRAAAPNESLS